MKKLLLLILVAGLFTKCKTHNQQTADGNKQLASLLQTYFNDRMQLFPLEATVNGDNRFNNLLPIDFTDSYRSKLKDFFTKNQQDLKIINRDSLNDNDKISYDIFSYEMDITLAGLVQHYLVNNTFMPFDQFNGVPIMLGQMGGGTGNQPFKTVADYDKWLQRAEAFSPWADSAIVYFKKGMANNYVLPKTLVVKMIPELTAMVKDSAAGSLFYGTVNLMPSNFSQADKIRLTAAYTSLIETKFNTRIQAVGQFFTERLYTKGTRNYRSKCIA